MIVSFFFVLGLLLAGARASDNVLLVIADDLGIDRVRAYGAVPDAGRTPNIDALAKRGVLFRNAWSSPQCAPTRAGILTGRYPFRTEVGSVVGLPDVELFLRRETGLPEVLRAAEGGPYTSVAVGKWGLALDPPGPAIPPRRVGFALHVGAPGNLDSYYRWTKLVGGVPVVSMRYATTDTVDDALRLLESLPEPWFLWLAFNAPHKPFHKPPPDLHTFSLPGPPGQTPVRHMKAMAQAMDTEIGRLLAGVDPAVLDRTTVVFVGDNGTAPAASTPPFVGKHAKGTVYQGGVQVPLIVAGPPVAIPGSECDALVSTTDLFATIAELAGADPADVVPPERTLDSVSFVPLLEDPNRPSLRRFVFTQIFAPNGPGPYTANETAIRGERYKLLTRRKDVIGPGGGELVDELYDLHEDPFEKRNLLEGDLTPEQELAHARLEQRRAALLASHG